MKNFRRTVNSILFVDVELVIAAVAIIGIFAMIGGHR